MELFVEIQKLGGVDKMLIFIMFIFVSSIIFSILDVFLFQKIFNTNISKQQKIVFIVVNSILKTIENLFIQLPYCILVDFIISVILLNKIINGEIERCIINQIISFICSIGAYIIVSKLLVNIIDTYKKYIFCLYVAIIFVRVIVYLIIRIKNLQMNFNHNVSKKTKLKIGIITSIGMLIIFLNSIEVIKYVRDFPYVIFLFEFSTNLLIFYFVLASNFKILKLEDKNLEIENLENYNKSLTIMYDNIRGFKHDYANFVQALNGYIQTNNMDGIKKMCSSVFEECKNINNLGFLDPDLINNAPIYSIISSKYFLAVENGITVNLEIFINFEEIQEELYELCRILAILLDNAIEAAKECDEKIINIRCIKEENKRVIVIENTYNQIDVDIGKIFEKGYTTKTKNNNEHGLGLWNVRRILSKSKKLNLYTSNDKMFCQKLEIYN